MAFCKVRVSPGITLATCLVAALAGCGSTPQPVIGPSVATIASEMGQEQFQAAPRGIGKLSPSDVLSVTVFREPDLSVSNAAIDADGMINMPLIGVVRASGSTPTELAALVEQKLAMTYLRDPHVSVNVASLGSHKITVEGAVNDPGYFDLPLGAKLSSAIAMAKGPSRVAKMDQVAVFRQTGDSMYVARFDYGAMQAGTMIDPVLQPGDRIVFGVSGLSQGWQDVLKTIPAIGVFTRF